MLQLQRLRNYIIKLRSNKTCLMCIVNMPEKVFTCGHAICDNCVRIFGQRSPAAKYHYKFLQCPICLQPHAGDVFQLLPPTAGTRILTLDGGGVRGIIPATLLGRLEDRLSWLGCPLRDHFDLVCGTSSGKTYPLMYF